MLIDCTPSRVPSRESHRRVIPITTEYHFVRMLTADDIGADDEPEMLAVRNRINIKWISTKPSISQNTDAMVATLSNRRLLKIRNVLQILTQFLNLNVIGVLNQINPTKSRIDDEESQLDQLKLTTKFSNS